MDSVEELFFIQKGDCRYFNTRQESIAGHNKEVEEWPFRAAQEKRPKVRFSAFSNLAQAGETSNSTNHPWRDSCANQKLFEFDSQPC